MYKSFGVRCDVHTQQPVVTTSSPDAFSFGCPSLYFWLRACFKLLIFFLKHSTFEYTVSGD